MSDNKTKAPTQAEADALELAELRADKAAQQAAATAAQAASPAGTTRYVNAATGQERDFTPETYAALAPDYAGYEVKPGKPTELPKA